MIGWLQGYVLHKTIETLLVNCGGVGYEVWVTEPSAASIEIGSEQSLYIYTHVREDALSLFGFASIDEKKLFLELLSVSGIGAKTALHMLSLGSVAQIVHAILNRDSAYLKKCPGVGLKTAERVVIDLFDRLKKWNIAPAGAGKMPASKRSVSSSREEAISALINLGYKKNDAEYAVEATDESITNFDQIFKESLKRLRTNA